MQDIVEGSIVHLENYKLPSIEKNKFFIVLFKSKLDLYLLSMTTSQKYINDSLITHGRIIDRQFEYHCFKADKCICTNGYYFSKDTFIKIDRLNAQEFSREKLEEFNFTVKGVLIKEELINLLYTFYTSDKTIKRIKSQIEDILFRLSN